MADTKISGLADGGSARNTDEVPAVRSGGNVRIKVGPSDFQPPIVTGRYYYPKTMHFQELQIFGDVLSAIPVWFSSAVTWTKIGIYCAAAEVGKSVRLGIYANGADNQPGALILDCGTVSIDAPGALELTISQPLAANTVYWLAAVSNADPVSPTNSMQCAYFAFNGQHVQSEAVWTLGASAPWSSSGSTIGMPPYVRSFSYAALPASWGTPDTDFTPDPVSPAIWLRKT